MGKLGTFSAVDDWENEEDEYEIQPKWERIGVETCGPGDREFQSAEGSVRKWHKSKRIELHLFSFLSSIFYSTTNTKQKKSHWCFATALRFPTRPIIIIILPGRTLRTDDEKRKEKQTWAFQKQNKTKRGENCFVIFPSLFMSVTIAKGCQAIITNGHQKMCVSKEKKKERDWV